VKSSSKFKSRIGVTLGDPGGIGPEIVARALASQAIAKNVEFVVIGPREWYERYRHAHARIHTFVEIVPAGKIRIGCPHPINARIALESLNKAVELIKAGEIQSLVTGPVCKEAIADLGVAFEGHTEFLAQKFHCRDVEMMFVTDRLKVLILTRHIPLKKVPQTITKDKILRSIRMTHQALKKYYKIKKPHIAVCGLNPHAGEGGGIGKEEVIVIIPAVRQARRSGFRVSGPFAADTLFIPDKARSFDAILAMYHDQGLTGIKSLAFDKVVNLTIGLPFIRTSPAHGTAFEIAGQNKARIGSMAAAINLAVNLTSR